MDGHDAVAALHRQAAIASASTDWKTAAHHYREAGDTEAMLGVVASAIPTIMGDGQYALAEAFIGPISHERRPAGFDLILSRVDMQQGDYEAAIAASQAVLDFTERDEDPQHERNQHRRADHEHHEDRPARPEHLAQGQIEDPEARGDEARSRLRDQNPGSTRGRNIDIADVYRAAQERGPALGAGLVLQEAEELLQAAGVQRPLHDAERQDARVVGLDRVVAAARRLVVLEGVGNPDNVGGIFRSAIALGVGGILLDPTSGDPWYRKALRTSMGAILRLPFARVDPWPAELGRLRPLGFRVVALSPSGSVTIDECAAGLDGTSRIAFMAGAEGPGLSDAAMAQADITVRIPVDPLTDSLNVVVAVAIALARIRSDC